jgi:hypothetical protein
MAGFIVGVDRGQSSLFPERLEDRVGEDHLVRVIELFVEELDLSDLGIERAAAARTGRPGYHPAVLLKLFIYGYLNRVPSSRRLEREAGRNIEVMWLTGRPAPDHKTIADSGATTALPSARPARSSSSSAAGSACCGAIASPSGEPSSRRSTTATATSPRERSPTASPTWRPMSRYIDAMGRIDVSAVYVPSALRLRSSAGFG